MNGSNFATPDNSGSVFPSSPAANYQVDLVTKYNNNVLVWSPTKLMFLWQESDGDPCVAPLATWVTVWGFPPSAASFILQQVLQVSSDCDVHWPSSVCSLVPVELFCSMWCPPTPTGCTSGSRPGELWSCFIFEFIKTLPTAGCRQQRHLVRMQACLEVPSWLELLLAETNLSWMPWTPGKMIFWVFGNYKCNFGYFGKTCLPYSMAVGTPTLDTSVANLSSNLGGTPRSIRPLTQAYRWDFLLIKRKLSPFMDLSPGRHRESTG